MSGTTSPLTLLTLWIGFVTFVVFALFYVFLSPFQVPNSPARPRAEWRTHRPQDDPEEVEGSQAGTQADNIIRYYNHDRPIETPEDPDAGQQEDFLPDDNAHVERERRIADMIARAEEINERARERIAAMSANVDPADNENAIDSPSEASEYPEQLIVDEQPAGEVHDREDHGMLTDAHGQLFITNAQPGDYEASIDAQSQAASDHEELPTVTAYDDNDLGAPEYLGDWVAPADNNQAEASTGPQAVDDRETLQTLIDNHTEALNRPPPREGYVRDDDSNPDIRSFNEELDSNDDSRHETIPASPRSTQSTPARPDDVQVGLERDSHSDSIRRDTF